MQRTSKRSGNALVFALCGACSIACTIIVANGRTQSTPEPAQNVITAHADELLPGRTAVDWVTYGDYLVRVRVDSEETLPLSEEDREADEGYEGRGLHLSVKDVLWRRESTSVAAPRNLDWQLDGWRYRSGARTEIHREGQTRLEVDREYVALITHLAPSERVRAAVWIPTNGAAIAPLSGNVILPTNPGLNTRGPTLLTTFANQAVGSLVATLERTPVDPAASPYLQDPPDERFARATD